MLLSNRQENYFLGYMADLGTDAYQLFNPFYHHAYFEFQAPLHNFSEFNNTPFKKLMTFITVLTSSHRGQVWGGRAISYPLAH